MPNPEQQPHALKERHLRHLRPEITRELLPLVQRLTARPPLIMRLENLPNDANGMLIAPKHPNQPWEIRFARGQERFLDHIIAHEVGHIVRLFHVPEQERLQPVTTPQTREAAIRQLGPHIVRLVDLGIPEDEVADLVLAMVNGLCSQLASFPADLRIEQWMYQHYPGLSRVQERSLATEVERAFPLFQPEHRLLTPPTVFRANMAMNAAQAWQVAALYRRPDLLRPFQEHGYVGIGRHLIRLLLEAPDDGHRSDMEAVNRWAGELGLTGWFELGHCQGSS